MKPADSIAAPMPGWYADFDITFTGVTGTVTRCDLFDAQCDTRPSGPDKFGVVFWTQR